MHKTLGPFIVIVGVLVAPAANAEAWYAGGFLGLNHTHDGSVNGTGTEASYDLGAAIGGYAGFHVQDNVRLEGELSYRKNDIDTIGNVRVAGDVETLSLMMNALFDIKLKSRFQPYLGAGLGFADVDYGFGGAKYDDTVLAIQMIIGAGIDIAPATQLTLDYRLFITDDLNIGGGAGLGSVEYTNSAFVVGVKRSF